jgi:RimJ/RimL family protein N-acetyltransferase
MADLAKSPLNGQSVVRLRPVEEADLSILMRFYTDADASGVFQWFGYRPMSARDVERQWKEDGLINDSTGRLVVEVDGEYAGEVDWRAVGKTGAVEIGICLLPDRRGLGIGTSAQRLLVEYLFAVSPVHRVQAGTEMGNVAEQRALERVGFRREGVLRSMYFRDGEYRDAVMFGLLRREWDQSERTSIA